MHSLARQRIVPLDKTRQIQHFDLFEPEWFQRGRRAGNVGTTHQQIHVLRGPNRTHVWRRYPRGDGVSANDRIRNARAIQRRGHGLQEPFNPIHGFHLPFEIWTRLHHCVHSYRSNSAAMMFRLPSTATTSLIMWPIDHLGKHW